MIAGQDDDAYFMKVALTEAKKAAVNGEVPVGAVLVNNLSASGSLDDRVLAVGFNGSICDSDPTAHAEIVAIRRAAIVRNNYRLPETTLYVTIEPCIMCVGAVIHARISRLVFGAAEPRAGALVSHPFDAVNRCYNHRFDFDGGILADDCGDLIKSFFRSRRNSS